MGRPAFGSWLIQLRVRMQVRNNTFLESLIT